MRKFGLIGYPLSHTFSPDYFEKKFRTEVILDAEYKAYPLKSIEDFLPLQKENLVGLNVTIPYKETVIQFLDGMDEVASTIGAVNTIKNVEGKLYGYNTDAYGFEQVIKPLVCDLEKRNALVLGTGGSSKAVRYVLKKMGYSITSVSTSGKGISYEELSQENIENHPLIVNTTPLGMSPNINSFPQIPYNHITEDHVCFDLIYNPEKTLFLTKSESNGASVCNGYKMLELQADKSWEIWNE